MTRTALAQELHGVAAANTQVQVDALDAPQLRAMISQAGRSDAKDLLGFICEVAAALPDPRMRHAVDVLFGDARWEHKSLGKRQKAAGAKFDVHSQAGWTRSVGKKTPSYHDQLLTQLGAELMRRQPNGPTRSTQRGNQTPTRPLRRSRQSKRAVVSGVVAVAVTVGLAVWQAWSTNSSTAPPAPSPSPSSSTSTTAPTTALTTLPSPAALVSCTVGLGQPTENLPAPRRQQLSNLTDTFVQLGVGNCALRPVDVFGDALLQELIDADNKSNGVILVPPSAAPMRLTQSQWQSYLEIAGRSNAESSRSYGGYPISGAVDDGVSMVELSTGGVLMGRTADAPHFWVPHLANARAKWEAAGGIATLGLPTSNPLQPLAVAEASEWYDEAWYLEFEHGYLIAPLTLDEDEIEVRVVDDRQAPLRPFGDLRGKIVSQVGKQAWYIDDQLVAHWIADLATWDCLGGSNILVAENIPGWAIASLNPGDNARC